jgi:hypothetical protein
VESKALFASLNEKLRLLSFLHSGVCPVHSSHTQKAPLKLGESKFRAFYTMPFFFSNSGISLSSQNKPFSQLETRSASMVAAILAGSRTTL